ncbi:ATPase associated with various cellular activities AAA_5 [Anaeromyxobacter dehalogenans 2CP-1]|uniref:ATPase associated with various cellular activities AAA_5 n=1 Tax=Anaeromyxobacter dehalogenans (strain ATCC BAA-258 / DSM 21875 / 2CP-1) TaxID=455488 RepID=B8JFA8_ANAD2|nr:AAA family ATPase [Anaeromyxobacter dehalogenans]ACL64465.1 ATPase associated with various cellular activities AAA_5 [Anaeromyxobacter dehalogenans 2CP-1]
MSQNATTTSSALRVPVEQLRQELNARFPERREVIDGALCAVLAGEHVLLLGPPGTAKSALVRSIARAFGGRYFERLLTKFSTPEELFGPVSLKALEQDRYARVIAGKLPEAQFAFVDEVFKANSAILNSLLTAMNERLFHNDGAPLVMPLVSLFGASNELPDGKELEALFDRFLLRFDVQYLRRPASFRAVVTGPEPALPSAFTLQDLLEAQAAAAAVAITDATVDALVAVRDACSAEGIVASDRRWKKSLRVVQAHAFLAGEAATTPEDLLVLVDALWREPKERAKVARLVGELADPVSAKAAEILDAARETAAKVAGLRSSDRKAYIASAAQALDDFKAQQARLAELARGAGPRAKVALADAGQEIAQLHADLARCVTHGLGLATAR